MKIKNKIYAEIILKLSELSKDPNTKVAAMIVRKDYSIVSVGYNGFPPGYPDTPENWNDRVKKNKMVLHAEDNAIDYSNGQDLKGCYIFVTHYPCTKCASKIIKKKIKKVYYLNDKRKDHDCDIVDEMFKTAKVKTKHLKI